MQSWSFLSLIFHISREWSPLRIFWWGRHCLKKAGRLTSLSVIASETLLMRSSSLCLEMWTTFSFLVWQTWGFFNGLLRLPQDRVIQMSLVSSLAARHVCPPDALGHISSNWKPFRNCFFLLRWMCKVSNMYSSSPFRFQLHINDKINHKFHHWASRWRWKIIFSSLNLLMTR